MKSFPKDQVNHRHKIVPFSQLEEGMIECQGFILKRLNKRIRQKKIVLEYYKCQNSYTRNKNCGPCKFSGKLVYQINSQPTFLEIIKNHSLFCLNKEGNKLYLCANHCTRRKLNKQKRLNIVPFEHNIYSNKIPIVNISVQIHNDEKEENNDKHKY